MKTDKFLLAIIIAIVLLVVIAVVLVLTRNQTEAYVADDSPAGVVHDYFLAIQRKDFERAYRYLSNEIASKPDLDEFIRTMNNYQTETALQIGESTITDNRARVEVLITTYSGGDLFSSGSYTNHDTAYLKLNSEGKWQLTQFPYPYWGYNWNEAKK